MEKAVYAKVPTVNASVQYEENIGHLLLDIPCPPCLRQYQQSICTMLAQSNAGQDFNAPECQQAYVEEHIDSILDLCGPLAIGNADDLRQLQDYIIERGFTVYEFNFQECG